MINAFNEDGERPAAVIGDLEFENIVFAYPTRKEVPVSISVNETKVFYDPRIYRFLII
jgi:hypothetical protein